MLSSSSSSLARKNHIIGHLIPEKTCYVSPRQFFPIYIVVVVEITSALQKTLMNECSHHQALKFNSFLRALFEKMCHCDDKNEESELVQKIKWPTLPCIASIMPYKMNEWMCIMYFSFIEIEYFNKILCTQMELKTLKIQKLHQNCKE